MSTVTTTKQLASKELIVPGLNIEEILGGGTSVRITYVINSNGQFTVGNFDNSTFIQGLVPYHDSHSVIEELDEEDVGKLKKSIEGFYHGKQTSRERIMQILK